MENNIRLILGQKARELRKQAKLTQQELANKLGFYREEISSFERRGEKLGLEKIQTLFDYFGYELIPSEKKTTLTCA